MNWMQILLHIFLFIRWSSQFEVGVEGTRCNLDPSKGEINDPCGSLYDAVCEGKYCKCPHNMHEDPALSRCVVGAPTEPFDPFDLYDDPYYHWADPEPDYESEPDYEPEPHYEPEPEYEPEPHYEPESESEPEPAAVEHNGVAPVLSIPNKRVGVSQGSDVTLECHTEAFPRSINYWTDTNNSMILSSGRFESFVTENGNHADMLLKIKNVQKSDYGIYSCNAKNLYGEISGTVKVYDPQAFGGSDLSHDNITFDNITLPQGEHNGADTLKPYRRIRSEHIIWKQGCFLGIRGDCYHFCLCGGDSSQSYTLYLARDLVQQQNHFVYIQNNYPHDVPISVCELQYGSYKMTNGTGVFYVYHNKLQTPYQKRFSLKADGIDPQILVATEGEEDIGSSILNGTTTSRSIWDLTWLRGEYLKDTEC